jgi:hypothetical protein
MIREINVTSRSKNNSYTGNPAPKVPQVLISGHGGGRWYGYFRDFRFLDAWTDSPGFRLVKISGTSEPLTFYHFYPEGQAHVYTKAEITNASNVNIFGYKDGVGNCCF